MLLFVIQVNVREKSNYLNLNSSKQFTNSYDSLKYYGLIRTKNKKVRKIFEFAKFLLNFKFFKNGNFYFSLLNFFSIAYIFLFF